MTTQEVYSILTDMVRRNAAVGKRSFRERYVEGSTTLLCGIAQVCTINYEITEYGLHMTTMQSMYNGRISTTDISNVYIAPDTPIGELLIRG